MDLLSYLGPTGKINDFIYPNPLDSAGRFVIDDKTGPQKQMIYGLLGSRYKFSEGAALKRSNTTKGTIYNCEMQMVRIDPSFGTVLLTDIIVGRPLFWTDKTKFLVSPLATATSLLAGISPVVMTSSNAKGDIIPLIVRGDVGIKLKASLTKASPLANDPLVLSIASSLATGDVLLDATGWTNVQLALRVGRVLSALNGLDGTVVKCHLDNAYQVYNSGIE